MEDAPPGRGDDDIDAPATHPDASRSDEPSSQARSTSEVWARRVFWLAVVVAVPVIRYLGRHQWFFLDEWDFLAARRLSDPQALFEPHSEHWTTLPIVVYRVLYRITGLNHYWPYQAVAIASHLGVVILVRATMIRVRTDPWLATALAVLLLFLGSGQSNITWGFQITFTGALLLGLAQMLLADHDGAFDRRDGLALLCGLGAIMCSGVGVSMVIGVGVAVLVRRGWRMALVQTAPLGIVYAAWYLIAEPSNATAQRATMRTTATYARDMVTNTFVQLGQSWLWAVALTVAVAAGAVVAVQRRHARTPADGARLVAQVPPLVLGTLVGAAAFVVSTSVGRSTVASLAPPTVDRYVYVVAVLTLPALGMALSPLVRGHIWVRATVVVFLLVGLPGNIADLRPQGDDLFLSGDAATWSQVAALAAEGGYPPSAQPNDFLAPEVTMGWLQAAVADGRMPTAATVDPRLRAVVDLNTSIANEPAPRKEPCRRRPITKALTASRGQQLRIRGSQATVIVPSLGGPLASRTFYGEEEVVLTVLRGPLHLRLTVPPGADDTFLVCN